MRYSLVPGIKEKIEEMRHSVLTIKKCRSKIHSPNPRKEMLLTKIDEHADAILEVLDLLENMP
jgi:hypothetical protein